MCLAFFLEKLRHVGAAEPVNHSGDQTRELPGAMTRFVYVPFETGAARLPETLESFDIGVEGNGHSR